VNDTVKSPGDFIRRELKHRGWSQRQLAEIIGRPYQMVNEILRAKRGITPETAVAIAAAFNTGPDIWLEREARYQASRTEVDVAPVRQRARLYELAPIREMEHRHWIRPTNNIEDLEKELKSFFDVESLDKEPTIGAATRRAGDAEEPLSLSQRAWCFRVKQLARAKLASQYDESNFHNCARELRKIAAYPQEVHRVPDVLSSYGIRFVVVEPLKSCKVDGVAMWLERNEPVIGLSLRYDRVDAFWFTLCHELSHILHRDESGVDCGVADSLMMPMAVKTEMERRADAEAATMLIDEKEITSFILRVGPLYSKDRVARFAHRIKIHPGIIVGQLQFRGEIGYHAHRSFLAKVRHIVAPAALTDGWGHDIDPKVLK